MNPGMSPQTDAPTVPASHRTRRVVGIVAAASLAVVALAGCLSEEQKTVQTQINDSRAAAKLSQLVDSSTAATKAQDWAEHLANTGRLEHSRLTDGHQAGTWCRLAENVGTGPSLTSIHRAFLNSPSHRANILNPAFTHMGAGVAKSGDRYYVVHEFIQRC